VADVRPLLGLRYDLGRVGSLSSVIAPPYDVISPEEQLNYQQKSPYNIVRLESGARQALASATSRQAQLAAIFSSWIREGILKRDSHPAFYLVEHRFTYQEKERSCWGLICRAKLELDQGQIRPHEATSSEPIRDRLLLLRACQANLSAITGLFQSEQTLPTLLSNTLSLPPVATAEEQGVTYHIWAVDQEEQLSQISDFFAHKTLYLADGHHRYAAAWAYRQEISHRDQDHPSDFVLMTLFNAQDPGLVVFPVHRLVGGLGPREAAKLESQLKLYFQVEELPSGSASWLARLQQKGKEGKVIGLYQPFERKFELLIPRWEKLQELLPQNKPPVWREIELNLLHRVIFKELLGIDRARQEEKQVSYVSDGMRAIEEANQTGKLAFLLNPLRTSQIISLAEENLRLPRKSSYFYPKTPAGLVINPLWA